MDTFCCTSGQKTLDRLRAMDTRSIPHDQQFARDVAQYMLQKAHDINTLIRLLLDMQQQLTLGVVVSSGFRGSPTIMFGIIADDDQVKDDQGTQFIRKGTYLVGLGAELTKKAFQQIR